MADGQPENIMPLLMLSGDEDMNMGHVTLTTLINE